MIQVMLFDVDGVVANGVPASKHLAREYGITPEMTADFFTGPFLKCLVGQADLKEELASYLPRWGWQQSVDDFVRCWFVCEHHVNEPLVAVIQDVRQQGIPCYLATNQEHYRTAYILNEMGLASKVDGVFSSAYIGYMKQNPAFFETVLQRLTGVQAKNILFWDDSPAPLATAREVGIQAQLYQDFADFEQKLRVILSQS